MPEDEIRIIAVKGAEAIVGGYFDGIVVDGSGATKVGETVLHPNEIARAVAETAGVVNDAVKETLPPSAKMEEIEAFGKEVFTDPDFLGTRQEILEDVVDKIRHEPIETVS